MQINEDNSVFDFTNEIDEKNWKLELNLNTVFGGVVLSVPGKNPPEKIPQGKNPPGKNPPRKKSPHPKFFCSIFVIFRVAVDFLSCGM